MFRCIVFLVVGGLASLWAYSLPAQEAVLGQKYGLGVHAYFAGDYVKAFEQLTSAIQGGSRDPRAFYFRGLSYLQLGRRPEATQDFRMGASLESNDVNKFYNVSKALERVQGQARVELEDYRVEARMAALEQADRLRKARYEAIQREESRVLREEPPAPEPIRAPAPVAAPAAKPAAAAPVAAPQQKPVPKAAEKPAAEKQPEKEPAKEPAAKPAESDPFAEPGKPAAGKESGLLRAIGKALGTAVGGKSPPKEENKEEKPAAEAKPAAEEKPAAEKTPAEKKASSGNPFE